MSTNDTVREFLMTRRANITPERADISSMGHRRVPGLRRQEVATLAGISVEYYTRLERGHIRGASPSILDSVAQALQLDLAEREYLFDLARTTPTASAPLDCKTVPSEIRASVQRVLDSLSVPAIVHNANHDLVAANLLGRAMYAPHFDTHDTPNLARFLFLDTRAREFYVDWALARRTVAAVMRLEAGRDPLNQELTALVGELSMCSPQFREDWAGHDVHECRTGTRSFRHPEVGFIDVAFDVFEMPGESGLQIVTYTVAPNTDSAEKFALLTSWAMTSHSGRTQTRGAGTVALEEAYSPRDRAH